MITAVTVIGEILGAIIASVTITNFIYYTKSQVDAKYGELRDCLNKGEINSKQESANIKSEIYEKLNENKTALENGMKEFIKILSDIKESDKDTSIQFITLVNAVKDELKNDYTSRYNDLLLLINTKANESDFNRLEQKFDKVTETITELKTIVEMQLKEDKTKN